MAWSDRKGWSATESVLCVIIEFSSSTERTLSINGNREGSAIRDAMSPDSMSGASLNESNRSMRPSDPQAMTRRLPPRSASPTKISTPSSTGRVSIPASSKTASIEPRVAIPTSLQPVHPIATARQSPLAVRRAISASSIEFAAA